MTDYADISRRTGVPLGLVRMFYDHVLPFEGGLTLPAHDGHTTLYGITEDAWRAWTLRRPELADVTRSQAALYLQQVGASSTSVKDDFREQALQIFYYDYVQRPGFGNLPEWLQIQAGDFAFNAGSSGIRSRWALGKGLLQTHELFENPTAAISSIQTNLVGAQSHLATVLADRATTADERRSARTDVYANQQALGALQRLQASGVLPRLLEVTREAEELPFLSTRATLGSFTHEYYGDRDSGAELGAMYRRFIAAGTTDEQRNDIGILLNHSLRRFRRTYYELLSHDSRFSRFESGWDRRADETYIWSEIARTGDEINLGQAIATTPNVTPAARAETAFVAAVSELNRVNMNGNPVPTLIRQSSFNPSYVNFCIRPPREATTDETALDRAIERIQASTTIPALKRSAMSEGALFTLHPDRPVFSASLVENSDQFRQCPGVVGALSSRPDPHRR